MYFTYIPEDVALLGALRISSYSAEGSARVQRLWGGALVSSMEYGLTQLHRMLVGQNLRLEL